MDEFTNKKSGKRSQMYRIVYRSNEKSLTKQEVNAVHKTIEQELVEKFSVVIRWNENRVLFHLGF